MSAIDEIFNGLWEEGQEKFGLESIRKEIDKASKSCRSICIDMNAYKTNLAIKLVAVLIKP